MNKSSALLIISFIILCSVFIFKVKLNISLDFASQLIVASVFFFALFSGFFIARQNDRYNKIIDIIAERDGLYSTLYRVFNLLPRIQSEMREIIRAHYTRILDNNDWAYNEFHPSTTITRLTKSMGSVTDEEADLVKNNNLFDGIWGVIQALQGNRKKIIAACQQRLLIFQWILVYIFAGLTIISFHFLETDLFWVNMLKIIFATSVFLVIILIKQLDNLSIFGKHFSRDIARDVLRIIDEADIKEIKEEKI
ncbi:hypothetical protein KKE19_04435 [Patescibacteria group bacterium]|nr:hypothetical protein [Patescibacteria group bacterium]MBU4367599.1 hypothetical protein [Patescibacteria group bacterium]MBU4462068.1 hypothetical protein [Patescibacteria group bacterium]MCG2700454.1 hypothetical protein [Candidatus Parcubacteria bacterium]